MDGMRWPKEWVWSRGQRGLWEEDSVLSGVAQPERQGQYCVLNVGLSVR